MKVSVFGLGKLGACVAAFFGSKVPTIGYDIDSHKVDLINQLIPPVDEPYLNRWLLKGKGRLSATNDPIKAVVYSDISFVVVPTPSRHDNRFSLEYVLQACQAIAPGIIAKNDFHIVAITSTVMPGDLSRTIAPCLEELTGKKCGVDFGLCYNPEFIALGDVMLGLSRPDFILIGESDDRSGQRMFDLYRKVHDYRNPPIHLMDWANAEITKLAVNTFVTTRISFVNMLSIICEKLPGGNIDIVTEALGADSRIGKKYLTGGPPYGGPCFPRDNLALVAAAEELHANPGLAFYTEQMNQHQASHIRAIVSSLPGQNVGILGLSYKPNTGITDQAAGPKLAMDLVSIGKTVRVHDPMARMTQPEVITCPTMEECIEQSEVVVIVTNWPQYYDIPDELFNGKYLMDCWRLYASEEHNKSEWAGYHAIGLGFVGLTQEASPRSAVSV